MAILKYRPQPVFLSKSFKHLRVYFSMSHFPFGSLKGTVYSQCFGATARHKMNTNLLFHLSAERKHPIMEMPYRQCFSTDCSLGGETSEAHLPTTTAVSWLSPSTSLIWEVNSPQCCCKSSGTTLDCSMGPWRVATKAQAGLFEVWLLIGTNLLALYLLRAFVLVL